MKSDVTYDLLIIGGGISACVFASQYLKNNITKKVGLIEIGRGLGGRSSTRISKKYKGWKLNHGSPNFNISNSCLLYTSPSPRDLSTSRMPSSA